MALTSLANVKSWLKVTTSDDDAVLTRLINQISGAALNYLERPSITKNTYTELRSGVNNQRLLLRNWPVLSITSLQVGSQTISAATSLTGAGYTLGTWDGTSPGIPQELSLNGYTFCRGLNNVQIVYSAGYCIQSEAATIPATPYQITALQPYGPWAQDDGVTYANGTALTPTTGTPTVGQYKVDITGTYTFAAADSGQGVLIGYSFTPAALEQAVIEWIGERYRYKDRIGQSSKSLGGQETAAYSLKAIPDYISVVFDGYKKFLPL